MTAFAALAGSLLPVGRAVAQDTLLTADDPSSTVLPELNVVAVTGDDAAAAEDEVRAVLDEIDAALASEASAHGQEADLRAALVDLDAETARLNAARDAEIIARNTAIGEADEAAGRLAGHQGQADAASAVLREIAVSAYVGGNDAEDPLTTPGFSPSGRRLRYLDDAFADQAERHGGEIAARDQAAADQQAATDRADQHEAARLEIEAALSANASAIATNATGTAAAQQEQLDWRAEQERLAGVLVDAKAVLADARRTATVVGADFPLVVLDAFKRASDHEAEHRPSCSLSWTLLAAISRVESGHGTAGGAKVDALGQTSNILGPQLTPESGFAAITDTDGGALDGDPIYDRAVGPMQFIPSSWRIYALDGNGDGAIDPLNYYDAALAAAEHLCRGGADTSTAQGLRSAVLSYNNSESYLSIVASLNARYGLLAL